MSYDLEASGGKEKPESTQTSILSHLIGEEEPTIYNTFSFEDGPEKKMGVMRKCEDYCIPKCNITYERHWFFTCVLKPDESIDQNITVLRTRAQK